MTNHPNRSKKPHYLITEPYDGSRVRILAAAATPERAMEQFQKVARARHAKHCGFFSPISYVMGRRQDVDNMLLREVGQLPTWPRYPAPYFTSSTE